MNDEGVSPVIGIVLMVIITVVLSLVIAFFVLGMSNNPPAAPVPVPTTKNPNPLLLEVPPPSDVDLSFYQNLSQSWIEYEGTKRGGCLYFSIAFSAYNPERGWWLISSTQTDPYSGVGRSHTFMEREGVIWDPLENTFFERESYYSYFSVGNTSRYY